MTTDAAVMAAYQPHQIVAAAICIAVAFGLGFVVGRVRSERHARLLMRRHIRAEMADFGREMSARQTAWATALVQRVVAEKRKGGGGTCDGK